MTTEAMQIYIINKCFAEQKLKRRLKLIVLAEWLLLYLCTVIHTAKLLLIGEFLNIIYFYYFIEQTFLLYLLLFEMTGKQYEISKKHVSLHHLIRNCPIFSCKVVYFKSGSYSYFQKPQIKLFILFNLFFEYYERNCL